MQEENSKGIEPCNTQAARCGRKDINMTNTSNAHEQVRFNVERATRVQTLRAMERLIVTLGTKHDYIAWLEAMPDDAGMSAAGGMDPATISKVADNNELYGNAVKAFARQIGPVLMEMANE